MIPAHCSLQQTRGRPAVKLSPMPITATWTYPTDVRFGAGRIAELADAAAAAGITRPLFVTDSALARLPITARALAALPDAALFCDIKSNPVASSITAGIA